MTVLNDNENQEIAKIRDGEDCCGSDKGLCFTILQCCFVQFIFNVSGNGASTSQRRHLFKVEFPQLEGIFF